MLASIYLFLLALQCVSGSTIVTYTDSNCSNPSLQLSGPDNGICQQTLSGVGSFKITTLDAGCVVTVYGVDAPYCDVNDNWAIYIDHCYANSSVNQFSIDGCITISNASSSSPFPSQSSASAAAKPSSVSSTGVKAGIGAGIAVAAIAVITIPIWILWRRRRQSAANIPRPNETEMSPQDKNLAAELHSHSIHGAFVPVLSREELQGSTVDLKSNEKKHHSLHELGGRGLVELE